MGLAVSIGVLAELLEEDPEGVEWFENEVSIINSHLKKLGLTPHVEPRELNLPYRRLSLDSQPYSWLHYLRLAYLKRKKNADWIATPLGDNADPTEDPLMEDESFVEPSHLVNHSDAEGFYIPHDFKEVIVDEKLAGGGSGSSYRLLEELIFVAPALGIQLDTGRLSDVETERIINLIDEDEDCEDLCRELSSWLLLYESARLSIEYKTAIVFQ